MFGEELFDKANDDDNADNNVNEGDEDDMKNMEDNHFADNENENDDNEDEYDDDDEEDVVVRWNIERTTARPCTCCCQLCACWVFLIVVLGILVVAVGSIEFEIGVPFYNRDEINQEREDSYLATERDADFVSTFRQQNQGECVHQNPTILTRNGTLVQDPAPSLGCQRTSTQFLRLLYISSDRESNIITPDNLQEIKTVEDRILSNQQLTRYCYLLNTSYEALPTRDPNDWQQVLLDTADSEPITAACERIGSSLNLLDSLYFDISGNETGLGYYLLPNDQVTQEYNFSQSHFDSMIDYWSAFGQQRTYDLSNFSAAVATVGDTVTVQNLLWTVTSSEFVTGSTGAIGLTTTYALGVPINGYVSSSEDKEDQYEDVGQWLWDEFDSYLKGVNIPGVDLYWNDNKNGMSNAETSYLATQSFSLFPISIVLVLLYLIIMQDSFFIGCMGIMQILLAFVPTLILYRYIIQQTYIGVLNLISFYIILGIGVDDIFVFADQFNHLSHEKRLDQRMQKTFNVAARAMFTTSCTTFISFMSNATSVFPAVSTFGIFSALLVAVNYCAVITFFPAVIAVYHTRYRKKWWDHPSRLFCCCNRAPFDDDDDDDDDVHGNGDDLALNEADDDDQDPPKDQAEEGHKVNENDDVYDDDEGTNFNEETDKPTMSNTPQEQEQKQQHAKKANESVLVRFFRDTWASWVVTLRYPILLIFVGVLALAVYLATELTADEDAPSTLPNGNQYKDQPDIV